MTTRADKEFKARAKRQKEREKDNAKRKGIWCCRKVMEEVAYLYGGESDCSCCSRDTNLYQCSKCKKIAQA